MVKVKSWLFTEVRGKVKKAEFRRRKNKVTELSQKRIPFNPRTERQQEVRKAYGQCVEEWNNLSESEKREWRIVGTLLGISGYNAFMRECISKRLGAVWYEITIDNSANSNDLTDYQVLLEIVNDSTFFEDCKNEQKYLEFYDTDKATLLNHFVEEFDTTNKNAKIWIKVPSIPANSTKTIYLKINTRRTTDLSNGENVFDFFDDFEGTEIDSDKWKTNSPNFSVENSIIKFWGDWNGNNYYLNTLQAFNSPKKIIGKWRIGQIGEDTDLFVGFRTSDTGVQSKNGYDCYYDGQGTGKYYEKSIMRLTEAYVLCGKVTDTEWHKFKIIFKTDEIKFWDDLLGECSMSGEGLSSFYLSIGADADSSDRFAYIDFIAMAKYTEPEPTVSYAKI